MATRFEPGNIRSEAAIRFARALDATHITEARRLDVVQDAQASGVSTFDALRAHILLRVANGSAQLVSKWLREIEFGDFAYNCEAVTLSQRRIGRRLERGSRFKGPQRPETSPTVETRVAAISRRALRVGRPAYTILDSFGASKSLTFADLWPYNLHSRI